MGLCDLGVYVIKGNVYFLHEMLSPVYPPALKWRSTDMPTHLIEIFVASNSINHKAYHVS